MRPYRVLHPETLVQCSGVRVHEWKPSARQCPHGPSFGAPLTSGPVGMNPSQLILSQPSGAGLQTLQMPSQPDVHSAPGLPDAAAAGVKKPQVPALFLHLCECSCLEGHAV